MDCITAREWMATAAAEELAPAEILQGHLSQCPSCRAEFEEWRRTWALLAAWADTEPPTHLDRAILAEVTVRAGRSASWLRRLASGRVWAAAAAAAVLAVATSLFVPYQESLRFCERALGDAGVVLPALALSFILGTLYTFLPLLVAVLPWVRLKGSRWEMRGATVGQAFAIIMVPYILVACIGLEATVTAGILLGTVTGALLGGAVSQWLIDQWPARVPA